MNNYVENLIRSGTNVAVIMTNGFQMRGRIVAIDTDCIYVKADGVDQVVYKHAVSTIRPA